MTHFQPVSARIFKKDGIVTGRIVHWTFDITCSGARRDSSHSIHVRLGFGPESDSVFIGGMNPGFGDSKKLAGFFTLSFELQPSLHVLSSGEPQSWKQEFIKSGHVRKPGHAQIHVIEMSLHHFRELLVSIDCMEARVKHLRARFRQ